jgi:hypothetical protein
VEVALAGSLLFVALLTWAVVFAAVALWKGPRRAWAIWKRIGQMIGDVIARVAMTVLFFTILVPFAIVARRQHDPLALKVTHAGLWLPAARQSAGLEAARRQF